MKLYYTTEARESAIRNIEELIEKINQVSGAELDYIASRQTTHYLIDLIKVIKAEEKGERHEN